MENRTKMCRACGIEKDFSCFGYNKNYKDKMKAKCKECCRLNRPLDEKLSLVGELKTCKACLEEKDLFYFKKRSDREYKYEQRCRKCIKEGKLIDNKVYIGNTKKCSSCDVYKEFDSYDKCKACSKGISSICKECSSLKRKEYNASLPDEIKKERKRTEYLKNRDRYLKNSRKYAENNRDKVNSYNRQRQKRLKYEKPLMYLKNNISALIRTSFSRDIIEGVKKGKKTVDILGCTVDEFRKHIETQFENWMSWDNYGNSCETLEPNCSWDLDHIIPISSAKTEEEIYALNHWSNFQPLCSYKNRYIKRGDLYPVTNLELKITYEHE